MLQELLIQEEEVVLHLVELAVLKEQVVQETHPQLVRHKVIQEEQGDHLVVVCLIVEMQVGVVELQQLDQLLQELLEEMEEQVLLTQYQDVQLLMQVEVEVEVIHFLLVFLLAEQEVVEMEEHLELIVEQQVRLILEVEEVEDHLIVWLLDVEQQEVRVLLLLEHHQQLIYL
jgi:hypothetical protein